MMKVFFGVDPEIERVTLQLGRIPVEVRKAIRKEVNALGLDIQTHIKQSMRETPRAAWSYKRGKREHFPSKPWEPPAVDGGRLLASIIIEKAADSVEIGSSGVEYARYLEEGTEKMTPRRFMAPAFEWFGPIFSDRIFGAASKGMGKVRTSL